MPHPRSISTVLAGLVLFDLVLVIWAFFAPDLWFEVWHGTVYDDPAGLVRRCGANWAAFLMLQAIALFRWQRHNHWIAIIAGVRLSDVFTDVTTTLFAEQLTIWGAVLLPLGSLMNVVVGLWLLRAWHALSSPG